MATRQCSRFKQRCSQSVAGSVRRAHNEQVASQCMKGLVPLAWRKSAKVKRAKMFESFGSHRFSHPALSGIDRVVETLLPRQGVFLEVGANDGYTQSNTYFLEVARDWSGILVEPLPSLYRRCARLRRRSVCFNVACVAPAQAGSSIPLVDLDLMSVTLGQQPKEDEDKRLRARDVRIVTVPTTTLSAVIDQAGFAHIDFMSIDVEGAEIPLLSGLDFSRHTPSWAVIETARLDEVERACSPWLVLVRRLSHHDYLFRSADTHSANEWVT